MVRLSMTSAYEKCPVCGKSLRAENLGVHLQDVHPHQADDATVRQARRRAAETVKAAEAPEAARKPLPWTLLLGIVAVLVVVIAAVYTVSMLTSRPFDPFQCKENSGGRVVHFHAYLNISINLIPLIVPGEIGIRPGCTGIIHTLDSDAREVRNDNISFRKIHFEGPVGHRYTVGDFFTVWDVPFSSTEIAGFKAIPDGPGAKIYMTVNNVVSGEYERYVLPTTPCDSLDTCPQIEIVYNP